MATKTAKKDDELEEAGSLLDEMVEDATPPEYPEGTPELVTITAIRPRARRAQFKERYADLTQLQGEIARLRAEVGELKNGDGPTTPEQGAAMYRLWARSDVMYDMVSELLVLAARDEAAMRVWVEDADDDTLATAFNAYQRRAQPGEVSSSAS